MDHYPVVIIGAGPAGLTAAYELVKRNVKPIVIEQASQVGGMARTEIHNGYRFDIGGHRFFTKEEEILQLWNEIMKEDFLKITRLSRIHYLGRTFNYPLDFADVISQLGIGESLLSLLSFLKAKLRPYEFEKTFEQYVTNRFGTRLYEKFFKQYTEKVWGVPCNKLMAELAMQRIEGLSFSVALAEALRAKNKARTLIREFYYPSLGPGMMWEKFHRAIEDGGGLIMLDTQVTHIHCEGSRIRYLNAVQGGEVVELSGDHYISSIPLRVLVDQMNPEPEDAVRRAAEKLHYRDFMLVGLVVEKKDLFPDQWIYVHDPDVKVGRIQNFKNWSSAMVPDEDKTSLGAEYFCSEGDNLWNMADDELIELASRELASLELIESGCVTDGVVYRQAKAYPVYDFHYKDSLKILQHYLSNFQNLYSIGRNGLHRYDNQDHSMLSGLTAVRQLF